MAALLCVACAVNGSFGGSPLPAAHAGGSQAATPNWTQPTGDELREAADADREGQRAPRSGEIAFSFMLPESVRGTSAGVYDSSGRLIRTLWSARPYGAGRHQAIWDGRDDYGTAVPPASYTIKVLANNVHYDWDGVIGVTEDSLAGPHNWDATASFPTSLAFVNGKAYVSGGYNEGRIEAYVFDEKTPFTVAPLNIALFTGGQFDFATTDGQRVYFAASHYLHGTYDAVVAFEPDGKPWSFPRGEVIPEVGHIGAYFINTRMPGRPALRGDRGVDVAPFDQTALTGLAVQRKGNLLAVAHGARGGRRLTPSLDQIFLFDKNSGAPLGKIDGIHSPQKMTFDLNGDLWVIEGGPPVEWYWDTGARLVRIHDPGGKNEVSQPIQGLENPVDVTVNPVNGHVLVADGGGSQQVKEFDPTTGMLVSALGTRGGYGQGAACNATVTNTSFWLDFNGRSTGFTHPWIAIDEGGDVWVGDFTANRILRFHAGKLIGRIEMSRWLYPMSVPAKSAARVFGGWNGMLEYQIDYRTPLEPSDPIDPKAPHSWRAVRNWFPCFQQAEAGQQASFIAQMVSSQTLSNGETYGVVTYHGGPFAHDNAIVKLPIDGKISFVNNRITSFRTVGMDPDGSFYRYSRSGPDNTPAYTLERFAVSGFDAQGFPEWTGPTPIATFAPDLKRGNPYPRCGAEHCDFEPTDGGIIPIYAAFGFNHAIARGDPAFHLGGLPVNGNALKWQAMPEKPILYPDGRGTFSALRNENEASEARAIHRDIFAGVNGNWQEYSGQYFHYREDGLLVGQFGWRDSDEYAGPSLGRPDPWNNQPLAPGYAGNSLTFQVVEVGSDYYLYNADESYRAGLHRWHISNLASIREYTAVASLGQSVQLQSKP